MGGPPRPACGQCCQRLHKRQRLYPEGAASTSGVFWAVAKVLPLVSRAPLQRHFPLGGGTSETGKSHFTLPPAQSPTYFSEVPHVKEVEGVEELAVPEAELVMTHFEECPDVLQAKELQEKGSP